MTNAERVALNLLDAGWAAMSVEFNTHTDPPTITVVMRTPPIAITDSHDYARLIALAMGGAPKEH